MVKINFLMLAELFAKEERMKLLQNKLNLDSKFFNPICRWKSLVALEGRVTGLSPKSQHPTCYGLHTFGEPVVVYFQNLCKVQILRPQGTLEVPTTRHPE